MRKILPLIIAMIAMMVAPTAAEAHTWPRNVASYYGPGLYGNRTACGQTLTRDTIGVAHRYLACGTKVTFKYNGRVVHVRVIDKGPHVDGRMWDLTSATVRRLGVNPRYWPNPRIAWHRSWVYITHR